MSEPRQYLRADDVAKKLGVSTSTIRKYVLTKKIPYIKMEGSRGSLLFDEMEIDTWLKSKRVDVQ
ncbi:MAG TPA: helix-turn-helix domain-containing protein [Bacteroidales bacterium]|nr:helix-turn-helix domain-containing protein [Bacteroidales bacterium]